MLHIHIFKDMHTDTLKKTKKLTEIKQFAQGHSEGWGGELCEHLRKTE